MEGLTVKLINGSKPALNMVKTMLSTPALINTDLEQGPIFTLPIETETLQVSGNAEVSEALVIASNKKTNIVDNVAPGSWTWNITGYIKGVPALEPTNYYTPIVKLNTDMLRSWFKKGAILTFKDGNCQLFPRVAIKELNISQNKDCANMTPVSLTLKEINVVEKDDTVNLNPNKDALAAAGSALGLVLAMGTSTATVISELAKNTNNAKEQKSA